MTDAAGAFAGPGPDAHYLSFLEAGEFRIQRCPSCGHYQFFPRVLCMACGHPEPDLVPASGAATVYSFTTVRNKPEAGGPHNFAVIELAEGPRMFSRVEGIEPDAVRIGMAVRARIVPAAGEGERPFIVFDPV
ncbi:MAG: Zn-ribbon domain-containing OB-fold protein [Alphaproteobacteria bacterium]